MIALRAYGRLLEQKPLTTKCITSFITFGAGDLICQYLEKKYSGREKIDFVRYLRQASFGFLVTPYLHLQFSIIMPKLFPATKSYAAIKSVLYDQTLGATIFTSLFYAYMDLSSGKTFEQFKEEMKVKFLPTLYANWSIWPMLMFINFSFVPVAWRVLFSNICGMFWMAYLSYMQNVRSKKLAK